MEEILTSAVEFAPAVIVLMWIAYRQDRTINRLVEAMIKRENCEELETP